MRFGVNISDDQSRIGMRLRRQVATESLVGKP